MVERARLVEYLDTLLESGRFGDYCPNGLQVEGRGEVRRLVTGVTASQALIDAAVAAGADALLVHHGLFWKGDPAVVVGGRRRRLAALLGSDLNLIAYHLPLDAHPELGNNARLASLLGFQVEGRFGREAGVEIAMYGSLPQPTTPEALAARLQAVLGRAPLWLAGGPARIARVAWCSGAAQSYLVHAAILGVDAFISGEVSESTTHEALEAGIHYFGAGHHATERYGVAALGEHLAARFGLEHRFIDIANPV